MLGELEEEWRGWEELGHQGSWHGEMGPETALTLSFSKDCGGHPGARPVLKRVGLPRKTGSFRVTDISTVFPISLFLKPRVSKYCWSG